MAVLIEGISVVIRWPSIVSKFAGGPKSFLASVPNQTMCSDSELVSIRFMAPPDVQSYVEFLCRHGLTHKLNNKAVDVVAVDQIEGIMTDCDWLNFGEIHWQNNPDQPVSVCGAEPTRQHRVFFPPNWVYENSLSAEFNFVEGQSLPEHMKFLRHENGVDVLLDTNTGIEHYMGRSSAKD